MLQKNSYDYSDDILDSLLKKGIIDTGLYEKCKKYPNLTAIRNRLEDFTHEEKKELVSSIASSIYRGKLDKDKLRGDSSDYYRLCESEKVDYDRLKKEIEFYRKTVGYDPNEWDSVDDFIEETYPNINKYDKYYFNSSNGEIYTDEEYADELFKYERSILEVYSDQDIANYLAHGWDLYDSERETMNRIIELGMTPPDWLVANVNKVDVARVNAIVSGSGEVRDYASRTNGIREVHTEESDGDGGLFTVIADSSSDVARLGEKVGATEIHHEDGDMYRIVVPYSL